MNSVHGPTPTCGEEQDPSHSKICRTRMGMKGVYSYIIYITLKILKMNVAVSMLLTTKVFI